MLDLVDRTCDYTPIAKVSHLEGVGTAWMDEFASPTARSDFLGQQLLNMAEDIREMRKEIAAIRAPSHSVYIQWIGLVIVGGAALWALAIRPMTEAQDKAGATFAAKILVDEKFAEQQVINAQFQDRFKEFATQKDLATDVAELKDTLSKMTIDIDRRLPRK